MATQDPYGFIKADYDDDSFGGDWDEDEGVYVDYGGYPGFEPAGVGVPDDTPEYAEFSRPIFEPAGASAPGDYDYLGSLDIPEYGAPPSGDGVNRVGGGLSDYNNPRLWTEGLSGGGGGMISAGRPYGGHITTRQGGSRSKPDIPDLQMYDLPDRGPTPQYSAPDWDETEVRSKTQEIAAPRVRMLREAVVAAIARLPSDPKSRLTAKKALAGYGTGLQAAITGAGRVAETEYAREFQSEEREAIMNYQSILAAWQSDYATAVRFAMDEANLSNKQAMLEYEKDYNEYYNA